MRENASVFLPQVSMSLNTPSLNTPPRTVILSDTHIGPPGRGARSAKALRPIWRGVSRLVLNGDIAEVHDPKWRTRAAREVLEIQDLCDQDGVELVMISGNHDPMISDRRCLSLCDGEVFVTHGDTLHPAISPWNAYAPRLRQLNEQSLAVLEVSQRHALENRLAAVQHAAHIDWDHEATQPRPIRPRWWRMMAMPAKVGRVFWYWATMHWRAYAFMLRHTPQARFFIFGHYHHSGIWRMGRRVVINTGCYSFPAQPLAVIIQGQSLEVRRVCRRGEQYHLADRARAVYPLTTPAFG